MVNYLHLVEFWDLLPYLLRNSLVYERREVERIVGSEQNLHELALRLAQHELELRAVVLRNYALLQLLLVHLGLLVIDLRFEGALLVIVDLCWNLLCPMFDLFGRVIL